MKPSMDKKMCMDCDPDQVSNDGMTCMMCSTGVPNDDQSGCVGKF